MTLNHRGVLVLNRLAYKALEMPTAVTLHFDEYARVIGLKAADPARANAFRVKPKAGSANHRLIHVSPFCRHFKIRVERTVLFNHVDLDAQGVMMLSLESAIRVGKRW